MAIIQRKCKVCDGWHYLDRWPHNCLPEVNLARSDFPSPHVISDTLPGGVNGLYHHGACKRIDSKSEYSKTTRALGYIEVGNERPQARRREHIHSSDRDIEASVAETLQEFEQKGIEHVETPSP